MVESARFHFMKACEIEYSKARVKNKINLTCDKPTDNEQNLIWHSQTEFTTVDSTVVL